jgi:hypothetical protein
VSRRRAFASAAALLALLLPPAAGVSAVGWPVDNPVITGAFGEDGGDHFRHGIEIGGAGQPVHPALDGELVFRYDASRDYSSVPRGTGSLLVLRHSQNILTLYAHLADGTLAPERSSYAASDVLGAAGDSGRAESAVLSFSVLDAEALTWVNPLAFLPPLRDVQAPLIRRIVLAVGDQRQDLADGMHVAPGRADILADVYDLRADVKFRWPLAPYTVRLALDGTEVARITFDSLSVRDGVMGLLPGGQSRKDLYPGGGLLRLGTVGLHAGASRLQVIVTDFAGNQAAREIALSVDSPAAGGR